MQNMAITAYFTENTFTALYPDSILITLFIEYYYILFIVTVILLLEK